MNKYLIIENNKVSHKNGVYLGDFVCGDDGFYFFWPTLAPGGWSIYILEEIVQLLKEKNKPIEDDIDKYFNEKRNST